MGERLRVAERESDGGERTKIRRQLQTIEQVRFGAALNPALLASFIEPSSKHVDGADKIDCDRFSLDLNDSQKNAVRTAIADNDLTLIQGPPGTGKTQVIAEICLQLYKKNPGIRILICSETHVAVNNLISRIAKQKDQIRIVRVRDKENEIQFMNFPLKLCFRITLPGPRRASRKAPSTLSKRN